jgi:hypothetical protein
MSEAIQTDLVSTHTAAAFYEIFPAEVARYLARRIKFFYTPVHGSWLNMVEVEISVLVRQCLKRRLPDMETLEREAKAWCTERNRLGASVDWRFRTEDARTKLRSLYPSVKVWMLVPSDNLPSVCITASRVSTNNGESWRLAGALTVPKGMPRASTAVERLVPRFPLSTGLLPAFSPPQGAFVMQQSTATSGSSNPTKRS